MIDEEKNETAAEVTEVSATAETAETTEAAPAEEKKENAFSKFWKKTKQSVNDGILENKIRSNFEKAHKAYVIYTKNELIPATVYGTLEGNVLTVFGKAEVEPYAVAISDDKEAKAYYVISTAEATVISTVEGEEYEREGTAITLDENVEEVNVVKAGKRYFIYKGEDKKD